MKLSVPTNWQKDLIPSINRECVDELYGKLAADFVGGGRPSSSLAYVRRGQARAHIRQAHKNNMKFNYLLNAACLNNQEFTISGQKRLHALLDWLVDIGVDTVTVAIPYLLQLIKKQYPKLKVYISMFAAVNSIEKAKYWQELGADQITLFPFELNRDFPLLKKIRENVKCQLQLIANNGCLYNCPFYNYHSVLTSHSSQSGHSLRGFVIDYCALSCTYLKLSNPTELIRADWIRPEDLHYYKDIGIDRIKLADRGMPTERISIIVEAYSKGYYNGNLLDLLAGFSKKGFLEKPEILRGLKYFLRPFSANVFRLLKTKDLHSCIGVYIDNRALDGFIEHFLKQSCRLISCQDCGYCGDIARQVVKIDQENYEKALMKYRDVLDDLISGGIFKYNHLR